MAVDTKKIHLGRNLAQIEKYVLIDYSIYLRGKKLPCQKYIIEINNLLYII